MIQTYVREKAMDNQWRIMVLEEFVHTALLHQVTSTRNINIGAVLEQYSVVTDKE